MSAGILADRQFVAANRHSRTSGSDSDFIVKLIDVFPQHAQKNTRKRMSGGPTQDRSRRDYEKSLDGYELPIAMEIRWARFNKSYSDPQALVPNLPVEFVVPLRDHDHVFLKGHQIIVQIQST